MGFHEKLLFSQKIFERLVCCLLFTMLAWWREGGCICEYRSNSYSDGNKQLMFYCFTVHNNNLEEVSILFFSFPFLFLV